MDIQALLFYSSFKKKISSKHCMAGTTWPNILQPAACWIYKKSKQPFPYSMRDKAETDELESLNDKCSRFPLITFKISGKKRT